MSDEAENELRQIREKMERGELNPRVRPEPTPRGHEGHYLDHLWALHLIEQSGCRGPEGER